MKISIIAPIVLEGPPAEAVAEFARVARPDCQTEVVFIDRGPVSIESEYEDALAVPGVIVKANEAAQCGANAVIINCMLDPGVSAVREHLAIPVLGPAQTSMHVAAMLGHRFSIITVLDRLIPPLHKLARVYGLSGQLASVRAINIPVLELGHDRPALVTALVDKSLHALHGDGADVIILGCADMAGLARAVQDELVQHGCRVPVVDPAVTTLKVAEALVDLGLSQSKLTFPFPPQKRIVGYPGL